MFSFRFTGVERYRYARYSNFNHLTFLSEFPHIIFYSDINIVYGYNRAIHRSKHLAILDSSATIKAIFPSRSSGTLLVIDEGSKCFHKIKVFTDSKLENCIKEIDSRLKIPLTVAKTNNFKLYIIDSAAKIWLIEEKKSLSFQTSLVHEWSNTKLVPSFMTIGAGNEYLYISTTSGVWQFSLERLQEKLIIGAGSLTDDGPIDEVNIKIPGSLISLNKDVLLIVDEGTQALRVANLQSGSVSSICKPHDSEKFVAGNISVCTLQKPKYLIHEIEPQNGTIYIGGENIYGLLYITIENQGKSSVF